MAFFLRFALFIFQQEGAPHSALCVDTGEAETFIPRGVSHHNVGQQGGATIHTACTAGIILMHRVAKKETKL